MLGGVRLVKNCEVNTGFDAARRYPPTKEDAAGLAMINQGQAAYTGR